MLTAKLLPDVPPAAAVLGLAGVLPFVADDVACTGTETSITSCTFSTTNNCTLSSESIRLSCTR